MPSSEGASLRDDMASTQELTRTSASGVGNCNEFVESWRAGVARFEEGGGSLESFMSLALRSCHISETMEVDVRCEDKIEGANEQQERTRSSYRINRKIHFGCAGRLGKARR